jgi:hypothetical protein
MRRKVAVCLGVTLSVAVSAATPALGSNAGHGCVGSEVASVAHFTQQDLNMGFGAYFDSVAQVPGVSIRGFSAQFCSRK